MGYKEISPTIVELATKVQRWEPFEGRTGLRGEVGETLDGDCVWITRVPSSDRTSDYAFTLFDAAAWRAFCPSIRITGEVSTRA
jgi:hypothetical protein